VTGRPRVAVIGGGIAGLTAAWRLSSHADVVLLEASDRLGGKIATEPFAGVDLDTGPDAFLARSSVAVELCRSVGLGDELVPPATGAAFLWSRGRLRPLPAGLVLGAPTSLRRLARSRVLSPAGTARVALDLVLPRRGVAPGENDVAVGALVRDRLGREALERLVDPLVGGINAGRSEHLSAAVVAPAFVAAAQHRSLVRGLRAVQRAQAADRGADGGPVFLTVRGGMSRLVDALAAFATKDGAEIRVGVAAETLRKASAAASERAWSIAGSDGRVVDADAVIVALPAAHAARLLDEVCRVAADELATMTTASVCLATLAYPADAVRTQLNGSGFLVPRPEGRLMTACSWVNGKWPHLAPPGRALFRVSAGRAGDERALGLADSELVEVLHRELAEALGLSAPPDEWRVHRWIDAFPQYAVGHPARVARIEAALADQAPGVVVAGSPYRGVGLATCIAGAEQAVVAALAAAGHSPV
jgi:protoporphyrinogen oxidase